MRRRSGKAITAEIAIILYEIEISTKPLNQNFKIVILDRPVGSTRLRTLKGCGAQNMNPRTIQLVSNESQ